MQMCSIRLSARYMVKKISYCQSRMQPDATSRGRSPTGLRSALWARYQRGHLDGPAGDHPPVFGFQSRSSRKVRFFQSSLRCRIGRSSNLVAASRVGHRRLVEHEAVELSAERRSIGRRVITRQHARFPGTAVTATDGDDTDLRWVHMYGAGLIIPVLSRLLLLKDSGRVSWPSVGL